MKKYKICVYAICKNEEKFIERLVKSMSEADEIYVLDTGSTDNSVKKLKKIAEYCKETGIPTVTINREYWTEEIQEIFDEQGIRVFVYTVNDQAEAEKYLKAGAAGICTDTLLEEKTSS